MSLIAVGRTEQRLVCVDDGATAQGLMFGVSDKLTQVARLRERWGRYWPLVATVDHISHRWLVIQCAVQPPSIDSDEPVIEDEAGP